MNLIKIFLGRHRKIVIAVITPVVLFVIASFVVASYETWVKPYKEKKALEAWQAKLEKPYREDVYGGATPEETWGLFLDALRAGDIDLASKYFAVDKREEYKKILKRTEEDNELNSWIKEMEKLRKDNVQPISKEKAYYFYNAFSKEYQQILSNSVIFYFNPYTKIWKILLF